MNMLAGIEKPSVTFPAFFRVREVGGAFVVTNAQGDWVILTAPEFKAFGEGTVERGTDLWDRLKAANLIRAEFDVPAAVARLKKRMKFLDNGPNLHMLVVTLRCNETCVYCHASRADMTAVETDMSAEIAEKSVELALGSPSPFITVEFQGGEPLVNFSVVKHAIEYGQRRAKEIGKSIEFTMVSNLALMDEEKLAFLLDHKVQICTSIDGPEHLHDKQRKLIGSSAFKAAVHWIKRINQAYIERGLDPSLYHVEALLTTTREALSRGREIVDTYEALGCKAMFLRPIDPFGFVEKTAHRVEYPREEYLQFYRDTTDYIIELNKQGKQVLERYAAIFMSKILNGEDPNFLDIRSPSGAGISAIAYNYDGLVFAGDEARMMHETGDDTFLLGKVGELTYDTMMSHPTIRALVLGSNLNGRPDCVNCAYNPYCGVDGVHTYKTQGSISGRMRESTVSAVHKGIMDYLFEKIREGDPETMQVFRRWTINRSRDHFVQDPV
ncbi:MAG: His-Xaa-Ser system radical SAM maturase HxsB [Deltaproteobacteria bacterium]|nr:His-Xaa-Ser system radical SAM maturase HxsB [Deltaproteobacteria bacterium]